MKYIIFTAFLLVAYISFAQPWYDLKRDYVWVPGADVNTDTMYYPIFDFSGDSLSVSIKKVYNFSFGDMYQMASSLCDENGNLLYFSNGCSIADSSFNIIPNGDQINFGAWYNLCQSSAPGYSINIGMIPIPTSNDTSLLFYQQIIGVNNAIHPANVRYSKVVNAPDGPVVVEKDIVVLQDTLSGHIAACRHGNGLDWWLIVADETTDLYYKWVVSATGIAGPFTQHIGKETHDHYDRVGGDFLFSPDGSKFIRNNLHSDVEIFDFDRCSGELSNSVYLPIQDQSDTSYCLGASISASSQYLYIMASDGIYQFDLWAADIEATKDTVAIHDGFNLQGWSTCFSRSQLGPDGKIYVSGFNNRHFIHVIEYPDLQGEACWVNQHKIILNDPKVSLGAFPNLPNFRLGALEGVICDSLVATRQPVWQHKRELLLSPNPTTSYSSLRINMPLDPDITEDKIISITDWHGRVVEHATTREFPTFVPLQGLPSGSYTVSVRLRIGTLLAAKQLAVME